MNPAIGQLVRKGKPVYYVTIDGQHIEGTIESLEAELKYHARVLELLAEGMCNGDAQAIADHELGGV